ncbi:MAG: glutamine synthetase [Burkholderiales bacterium]|nr:glutamine synthetase [Burkholderiales bacterium]
MSLVRRHGLWSAAQHEAAREMAARIRADGLAAVRFVFADQHGVTRGKTLVADAALAALEDGVALTSTLLFKDTAHRTAYPVFAPGSGHGIAEWQGAGDMLIVPDPATFRVLPWAASCGWVLCDPYLRDGSPAPFGTRHLLARSLAALAQRGFAFRAGLEVEFHVFRATAPRMAPADAGQPGHPPEVELLSHGYQYLTELRYDLVEPVADLLRRNVQALGLPLRSMEVEYGPSQFEFTFDPQDGLANADAMLLFRSAVKQVCRRHGYHATFMCRPRLPNVFSSGWHLHQSLVATGSGAPAFAADAAGAAAAPLSAAGMAWLGGLLAHARGATALAAPTINGYRRFRPNSLAPDRVTWGRDNRAAMLRVIAGAAGAARIENRIGEPAANPYLYFAAQVIAGMDGLARNLDPGPGADAPYQTEAPALPRSLAEALAALRDDACLVAGLGADFVDYFCRIKESEIARFEADVTEWEQREYFEMF